MIENALRRCKKKHKDLCTTTKNPTNIIVTTATNTATHKTINTIENTENQLQVIKWKKYLIIQQKLVNLKDQQKDQKSKKFKILSLQKTKLQNPMPLL